MRWVALETEQQRASVALARSLVTSRDAHLGHPALDLKRNLRRLDYALEKFGITKRLAGTTGHGLRHGNVNDLYESIAGVPSPVRGGGTVAADVDHAARLAVSERAGHSRARASGAYIGAVLPKQPTGNRGPISPL